MAGKLPEDILKTIERYNNPPNRLRSIQEINARYLQMLDAYKKVCLKSGDDFREQKVAMHSEIKTLGWVLGKPDKDVIKDIADHSNRVVFPGQF
jgi:aminoglycoside N3'-acetyltransferase